MLTSRLGVCALEICFRVAEYCLQLFMLASDGYISQCSAATTEYSAALAWTVVGVARGRLNPCPAAGRPSPPAAPANPAGEPPLNMSGEENAAAAEFDLYSKTVD